MSENLGLHYIAVYRRISLEGEPIIYCTTWSLNSCRFSAVRAQGSKWSRSPSQLPRSIRSASSMFEHLDGLIRGRPQCRVQIAHSHIPGSCARLNGRFPQIKMRNGISTNRLILIDTHPDRLRISLPFPTTSTLPLKETVNKNTVFSLTVS